METNIDDEKTERSADDVEDSSQNESCMLEAYYSAYDIANHVLRFLRSNSRNQKLRLELLVAEGRENIT